MSNTIAEVQSNSLNTYTKSQKTDNESSFLEYMGSVLNDKNSSYSNTTTTLSGSTNNVDPAIIQSILDSLSTDYTNVENLSPTDITFEDYQKLSYEALEKIFNGDSEKIGLSSGLMKKAQLTNDEVLNKIYFDEEVKSNNEGTSNKYNYTLGVIAIMDFKIDSNMDAFLPNDNSFAAKLSKIENNVNFETESLYTTKEKLFSDFDRFKEYYENTKENWTNAIDMDELFQNMDEIKSLYNEKVSEANVILDSYTRNIKWI